MRAGRALSRPDQQCEMCGEPIAEEHSHVVNVASRSLLCTCRACYLLFTQRDAALAYYAVPDRYLSFPAVSLIPETWDELQIPVGVAFFFHNSALGRTVAFYPSPAGATESELPLGAWDRVVAGNAALGTMASDVEALLVRRAEDQPGVGHTTGILPASGPAERFECFLVPIDACYELVGQLRRLWRGFDGGQEAHTAIDEFFQRVRARSRPAQSAASAARTVRRTDFGPGRATP